MNGNGQLEFLDILTVISFVIQLQNQQHIIDIKDVQGEVDRAVDDIHSHLAAQDKKINRILELLEKEEDK